MKFSNLLHPIYDETFPSWLTRCALNPKISGITERDIADWYSLDFQKRIFLSNALGMEFDFNESRGLELASELQLDIYVTRKLFKPLPTPLLTPQHRVAYCHLCIRSDVSQKRYPSWRKSWCYVTHPYCSVHRCLLSYIDRCEIIDKQWGAYVSNAIGDYVPGRLKSCYKRKPGIFPRDSRAWLTLRVQKWIEMLHKRNSCALPGTNIVVETSKIITAVDLIIRIFLIPRTRRYSSGVASLLSDAYTTIVHHKNHLSERIEYGAPNSVPYERMCALLLLGVIFKIFSQKELSLLHRLVSLSEFNIPDFRVLGKLITGCVDIHENEMLVSLLNNLGEISLFLREFIEGVSWKLA